MLGVAGEVGAGEPGLEVSLLSGNGAGDGKGEAVRKESLEAWLAGAVAGRLSGRPGAGGCVERSAGKEGKSRDSEGGGGKGLCIAA